MTAVNYGLRLVDSCQLFAGIGGDVAAVVERLIAPFGFAEPLRQVLILLVALRDVGKINAAFRGTLHDGISQKNGRHWDVSEVYVRRFNPLSMMRRTRSNLLYAAAAGHYSRPPFRDLERNTDRMLRLI